MEEGPFIVMLGFCDTLDTLPDGSRNIGLFRERLEIVPGTDTVLGFVVIVQCGPSLTGPHELTLELSSSRGTVLLREVRKVEFVEPLHQHATVGRLTMNSSHPDVIALDAAVDGGRRSRCLLGLVPAQGGAPLRLVPPTTPETPPGVLH